MPSLPLKTSYWPAGPAEPTLDTAVGGVLRAAAERAPDLVALTAGEADPARRRQRRYGELLADAERGGRSLRALFEPGAAVAVWAGICPEKIQLEFAAGPAGLTLVPVNPASGAEELAYVLRHARARGLFLAAGHRGRALPPIRLPELREVIRHPDDGPVPGQTPVAELSAASAHVSGRHAGRS